MTPDREPNRLPLRAGAMLLFALAVVCIGLGWHSAVTSTSSPEADLRAAAESSSASPSASPSTSASGSTAPLSAAGESSASASSPLVCVYNAGSVSGLAQEVNATLKSKGWRLSAPGNLQSASITENTVFYPESLKSEAEKLVADLGNDATADLKPTSFTRCRGGLAVIVITR